MNPRPIHRSRLFWLGLPGLFFLVWLWLGTRDTLASALWTRQGHRIEIVTSDGVIQFARTAPLHPEAKRFPKGNDFEFDVIETATAPLLPRPFHLQREELFTGLQQTLLNLAHWLLLLTYTLLWLAVTIAWHRRKHRLATTPSTPLKSSTSG